MVCLDMGREPRVCVKGRERTRSTHLEVLNAAKSLQTLRTAQICLDETVIKLNSLVAIRKGFLVFAKTARGAGKIHGHVDMWVKRGAKKRDEASTETKLEEGSRKEGATPDYHAKAACKPLAQKTKVKKAERKTGSAGNRWTNRNTHTHTQKKKLSI